MQNLIMRRISRNEFGTVSIVQTEDNIEIIFLAYEPSRPIPAGRYLCVKGPHPLHGMSWELHNVPGHTGILIHSGNGAADTKGCILPGLSVGLYWSTNNNDPKFGVRDSRVAYDRFLALNTDTDKFYLTIFDAWPHNDL